MFTIIITLIEIIQYVSVCLQVKVESVGFIEVNALEVDFSQDW